MSRFTCFLKRTKSAAKLLVARSCLRIRVTTRSLFFASCRALRLVALNWWFALVLATLGGAYALIYLVSVHRTPARVFIALYPDAPQATLLQIEDGRLRFGFPSARADRSDINIFLSGVTLTGCDNFDAGEAMKTGISADYSFTAGAPPGGVVRITISHPGGYGFVECRFGNVPKQRSFTGRVMVLQLDSVLWSGHLTNDKSDYIQETEQRIGFAANNVEVAFPSSGISEFTMSGGLPSQYRYPSPRELFQHTAIEPPLWLAPNRVRLNALENPLVTAEWQDDGAKELRDVILLIAGTLLGTAGAALIEWVKSIQKRWITGRENEPDDRPKRFDI
jgi:hypothetical protein